MGEMRQKQISNFHQTIRFSDIEIGIIKSFFAENDSALIAIRKVFLQKELDEIEAKIVKGFTKDILNIIERELIPKLDPDTPVSIVSKVKDWWSSFDFANMSLEKLAIDIQSRELIINYLTQQLNILKGPAGTRYFERNPEYPKWLKYNEVIEEISFNSLGYDKNKNIQQGIIELNARGSIIKSVEDLLISFKMFAGEKKETPQQARERLFKDSNK